MEFKNVIENRISVRNFKTTDVADEKIREMLSVARLAPSAGNLQSFRAVIVIDKLQKEELSMACFGQSSVKNAPVSVVLLADIEESEKKYGQRGRELYAIQDATIFGAYLQLTATNMGLSSVWVGAFSEEQVLDILEIKEKLKPIGVIPIGYADFVPERQERKKMEEIILEIETDKDK